MSVQPVFENDADEKIKAIYKEIKEALESQSLPIFFSFIGAFPEYLAYISDSLIANLKDAKFKSAVKRISEEMIPLIISSLKKPDNLNEWIGRYQHFPGFYYFQNDIDKIFLLNLKLAFIFVALREAVKGWAVAAKRLDSSSPSKSKSKDILDEEDFIFDQTIIRPYQKHSGFKNRTTQEEKAIVARQHEITKGGSSAIEKDILSEYFNLCRIDFSAHMKTGRFWAIRIGLEEMILNSLPFFPRLIESPINVVIRLTSKYPDFPDLLYLLSEYFPTSSVQRMMFSGYMKIER